MRQQYLDQRDLDAQNYGAARYRQVQAQIRANGNRAVARFAAFVFAVLALAVYIAGGLS